jgi:glycosyltransferase involved in cell wall biosynthesis
MAVAQDDDRDVVTGAAALEVQKAGVRGPDAARADRRRCRVLLIGPLPPAIGGDTRIFSLLVSDLAALPGFEVTVIDTARGRQPQNVALNALVMIRTIWGVLVNGPRAEVISFHASDRGMATVGPVLRVIARLLGKRFICRLFGGSFDSYYATRGGLVKRVIERTVLASDVCLFQTRRLVDYFTPIASGRVEWFSNYTRLARPADGPAAQRQRQRCERLVFVGHMWVTKGIDILLQSVPFLPDGVTIDLYGPLDDYSEAALTERGRGRIVYRGVLTNDQVLSALPDYQALVLPTFHDGEGYPGVIVEAFARGLPVIASRWLSIPEIVDDSCGILIEPKNVDSFVRAVRTLHEDDSLYHRLRHGALARSEQFGDVYWTNRFAGLCLGSSPV